MESLRWVWRLKEDTSGTTVLFPSKGITVSPTSPLPLQNESYMSQMVDMTATQRFKEYQTVFINVNIQHIYYNLLFNNKSMFVTCNLNAFDTLPLSTMVTVSLWTSFVFAALLKVCDGRSTYLSLPCLFLHNSMYALFLSLQKEKK